MTTPSLERHVPRQLVYLDPIPDGLRMRLSGSKLVLDVADRADALRALSMLFDPSEYVVCMN